MVDHEKVKTKLELANTQIKIKDGQLTERKHEIKQLMENLK